MIASVYGAANDGLQTEAAMSEAAATKKSFGLIDESI
jgi:hypothetical protein